MENNVEIVTNVWKGLQLGFPCRESLCVLVCRGGTVGHSLYGVNCVIFA